MANKIFIKHGFELKSEFKLITELSFRSVTESIDFENAELASKTINNWCEEKTNKRIKDIIKAGESCITSSMIMYITVEVIYFFNEK